MDRMALTEWLLLAAGVLVGFMRSRLNIERIETLGWEWMEPAVPAAHQAHIVEPEEIVIPSGIPAQDLTASIQERLLQSGIDASRPTPCPRDRPAVEAGYDEIELESGKTIRLTRSPNPDDPNQ